MTSSKVPSGKEEFNPIGFITDGQYVWVDVFGYSVRERLKRCKFHSLQSVQRHCVHLESRKSKRTFKKDSK